MQAKFHNTYIQWFPLYVILVQWITSLLGMFSQQRKVPLTDTIQQLTSSDFKKPNYVHSDYRNIFVCVQEKLVLLLIHGFQSACTLLLCDYRCLPNRGKPHYGIPESL